MHQLGLYFSREYADPETSLSVYFGKATQEAATRRHNQDYAKAYGMMIREASNNLGVLKALAGTFKGKEPSVVYASMQALDGMLKYYVPTRQMQIKSNLNGALEEYHQRVRESNNPKHQQLAGSLMQALAAGPPGGQDDIHSYLSREEDHYEPRGTNLQPAGERRRSPGSTGQSHGSSLRNLQGRHEAAETESESGEDEEGELSQSMNTTHQPQRSRPRKEENEEPGSSDEEEEDESSEEEKVDARATKAKGEAPQKKKPTSPEQSELSDEESEESEEEEDELLKKKSKGGGKAEQGKNRRR